MEMKKYVQHRKKIGRKLTKFSKYRSERKMFDEIF